MRLSKTEVRVLKMLAADPTCRITIRTLTTPNKETAWIKGNLDFPLRLATVRALERKGLIRALKKSYPIQEWAQGEYAITEAGRDSIALRPERCSSLNPAK